MDTRVTCPGCLKKMDPSLLNHTRLGIDVETVGEGVSNSIHYCPECGPLVAKLGHGEFVDRIVTLVRAMIRR